MNTSTMDLNLYPQFPKIRTSVKSAFAMLLCACTLAVTTGCTQTQIKTAVQEIANTIPSIQPYIDTAASIAATLDPASAPVILGATVVAQTALTEIGTLLTAYASAPSSSAWASIVAAVNALVDNNATALLDAAHIVNTTSRARAVELLGALQTALLLLYSIIQRVGDAATKTLVNAQAKTRVVKLSQLKPYLDRNQIETATGVSFETAFNYEVAQGF